MKTTPRTDGAQNAPTMRDCLEVPFKDWLGDSDWLPWVAFLMVLFGEKMTREERAIFKPCTGRTKIPNRPFTESWVIAGRRARKSAIAALIAVYVSVYRQWPRADGETVRVLIIAVSKQQARIIRSYIEGILGSMPALQRLVKSSHQDSVELRNGIELIVQTNSFRSVRGPTVVCAIFEELAFWFDESSQNPDTEVLRAVRPSMLTVPGSILIGISSPYAKRGLLYQKYQKHFARDDSKVLVWKAATQVMNPSVDASIIEEAYADDPLAASAEYGAQFRDDIASFVDREAVEACISSKVFERPPQPGIRYHAFIDPAGGSGKDSMALAIGHLQEGVVVIDALRERKPRFSPASVVEEFSTILKTYRISTVTGDRFGGEWARSPFKERGIAYRLADAPKAELYQALLPSINSGKLALLDNERLTNQICGLERRTARGGRGETIDHAVGGHDDLANVVAGVVHEALRGARRTPSRIFPSEIIHGDWRHETYVH